MHHIYTYFEILFLLLLIKFLSDVKILFYSIFLYLVCSDVCA
jgi:hypothetical protein